jgi:hypothetical protein
MTFPAENLLQCIPHLHVKFIFQIDQDSVRVISFGAIIHEMRFRDEKRTADQS